MGKWNKNKSKKTDLLEMSDSERIKLIKKVKETLQHKRAEAKLWRSLLELENIAINGAVVYQEMDHSMGYILINK